MRSLAILITAVFIFFSLGQDARADTCSAVMVNEPRVGGWCFQDWVNYFWDAYDFDKGDWDDGFGFSSACDLSRPLGRTFNAIYVLNYADGPGSTSTSDYSGSILHWGGNYSMREIDELDARCGDGTKRAYTKWGPIIDNYTELYLPFFYNENVVERAGTLLHEARHADWCGHNGNDGTNKCPAASNSCDESFENGCDGIGAPSGRGGTGFQALWLWWFTVDADSITGTSARKDFARDEANRIFDTMFDVDPCINITSSGAVIDTCPSAPPMPDLVVHSLSHSPANPTTDDRITFTAIVRNIGTAPAGISTLSFRVGGETPPGHTFAVPALAVGATYTATRQETLSIPQNYLNTAVIDINNQVLESNEANNQRSDSYQVKRPPQP